MSKITRVALAPIGKGSLTRMWLAVLIAIAIGAGIAFASMPKQVTVETLVAGTGPNPTEEDVVFVKYKGKLAESGEVFDESRDVPLPIEGIFPEGTPLPLSQMVPGFREALLQAQKGGKYDIFIPADKGYGASPPPESPIPPNADLEFEVELVDFMGEGDFQRRVQMLQSMMQGPPGGAGAPGSPGPMPPPGR